MRYFELSISKTNSVVSTTISSTDFLVIKGIVRKYVSIVIRLDIVS